MKKILDFLVISGFFILVSPLSYVFPKMLSVEVKDDWWFNKNGPARSQVSAVTSGHKKTS